MYTLDLATPDRITGRIVGDARSHIAVVTVPGESGKTGHLLAVALDGRQYVTWAYGLNIAEMGVLTWWGHYFDVEHYADAGEAFDAAVADLHERTGTR